MRGVSFNPPPLPSWMPYASRVLILAIAYFLLAGLGLSLASVQANVSPVWPPSGLALAALLLFGERYWPGVLLGAFFENLLVPTVFPVALGIAIGNTLAALAGATLMRRFAHGADFLEHARDVTRFVLLAGLISPMVSATIGNASLAFVHQAPPGAWPLMWLTWWLGDAAGIIILTPTLLGAARLGARPLALRELWRPLVLVTLLLAVAIPLFGVERTAVSLELSLVALFIPLLVLAAFWLGPAGVSSVALLTTIIAIWGTLRGHGPFVAASPNESLLTMQIFLDAGTASILILAAVLTERRRAEASLRRQFAVLKAIGETSLDGYLVIDERSRVIAFNRRFMQIWGLSEAVMATMDGQAILHDVLPQLPDPDTFLERIRQLNRHPEESMHDEVRLANGLFLERYSTPVVAEDAQCIGRVWYFRDISERKRDEELLRQQNEQLKELDRLKSSFVSSVSHELRTPLSSIMGFAEFLEEEVGGSLSPEQHGFVAQLQAGAQRLNHLVDDLLDFARLESGDFRLMPREGDLTEKVRDIVTSFQPQARRAQLQLETTMPPSPVVVTMDAERIGQVVANLVGNALKFTPAGGKVTVAVLPDSSQVRVEVRDTGVGIAPEHLEKLFQKFYQVDPTLTREKGGAGLGLAIARALIHAHGGDMGVLSRVGHGSTFWFTLPLTHAPISALER